MNIYNVKLLLTEPYEAAVEAESVEEAEKIAKSYRIGCVDEFERTSEPADYRLEITDAVCNEEEYIEVGECNDRGLFQYSLPSPVYENKEEK